MLQAVHAQAGGQHQDDDNEHRGQQLLPLAGDDLGNHIQGVVVGVDPEQPEDPHHPEHPEGHRPGGEKDGQIVGQEGQQIHQPAEGKYVLQQRPGRGELGVEKPGCPQAQAVVHREKDHRNRLNGQQPASKAGAELLKGVDYAAHQVDHDGQGVHQVVEPADPVLRGPHLYNIMHPSPAAEPNIRIGHRCHPSPHRLSGPFPPKARRSVSIAVYRLYCNNSRP